MLPAAEHALLDGGEYSKVMASKDEQGTIVQTENETRYEYRVNGKLRGIRVFPIVGPSYLLVDVDGDGNLDRTSDSYGPNFLVNSWVLFSW